MKMKVAIVHELLTMKGGAERLARGFAAMYPEADIFTLLYDERHLGDWFPRERVRTSGLQRIAAITHQFNHHLYLPFFRHAIEAFDFSGYDLIIGSSSAFVHGLRVPPGTAHVCYVHTPARYLWDQTVVVQERINPVLRPYASHLFHQLRTWDASAAARATAIVAASETVKRRIELYWGQPSTVVHPFADDAWFSVPPKQTPTHDGPFLVVANLRPYKLLTRAITACKRAHVPLAIVGEGPYRSTLEAMAKGADVRFHGRVDGEALRGIVRGARALLIPGEEDFGINAVEALACGTPVITVRGGGTTDIVDASVGAVCDATDDAFAECIRTAHLDIDPHTCRTRAERFTRQQFEQQMYTVIEAAISARAKASL